ncbi:MAG: hypothetical protein AAGH15_11150 [Myxococcota bacterium]
MRDRPAAAPAPPQAASPGLGSLASGRGVPLEEAGVRLRFPRPPVVTRFARTEADGEVVDVFDARVDLGGTSFGLERVTPRSGLALLPRIEAAPGIRSQRRYRSWIGTYVDEGVLAMGAAALVRSRIHVGRGVRVRVWTSVPAAEEARYAAPVRAFFDSLEVAPELALAPAGNGRWDARWARWLEDPAGGVVAYLPGVPRFEEGEGPIERAAHGYVLEGSQGRIELRTAPGEAADLEGSVEELRAAGWAGEERWDALQGHPRRTLELRREAQRLTLVQVAAPGRGLEVRFERPVAQSEGPPSETAVAAEASWATLVASLRVVRLASADPEPASPTESPMAALAADPGPLGSAAVDPPPPPEPPPAAAAAVRDAGLEVFALRGLDVTRGEEGSVRCAPRWSVGVAEGVVQAAPSADVHAAADAAGAAKPDAAPSAAPAPAGPSSTLALVPRRVIAGAEVLFARDLQGPVGVRVLRVEGSRALLALSRPVAARPATGDESALLEAAAAEAPLAPLLATPFAAALAGDSAPTLDAFRAAATAATNGEDAVVVACAAWNASFDAGSEALRPLAQELAGRVRDRAPYVRFHHPALRALVAAR